MDAVPEVGGNIPVKIDLGDREMSNRQFSTCSTLRSSSSCMYGYLCHIHGGGFPGPVVAQKSSDLALVKIDAEAIHCRSEAAAKDLDQVQDTDPLHQVSWLCLKESLTCTQQRQQPQPAVRIKPACLIIYPHLIMLFFPKVTKASFYLPSVCKNETGHTHDVRVLECKENSFHHLLTNKL